MRGRLRNYIGEEWNEADRILLRRFAVISILRSKYCNHTSKQSIRRSVRAYILGKKYDYTYREIAEYLGVTTDRARQIIVRVVRSFGPLEYERPRFELFVNTQLKDFKGQLWGSDRLK